MPFSKITSVFTARPEEVRFCDITRATPSRLPIINRTAFFLRIGAFLGFAGLLAFARGFFKDLNVCVSFRF